ncbi:sigma-70 family RNA polymerase sigma factor [Myxococcota bacterium]|nr:sigma-70 family RNA polymerase sigma factor [Myxococcota bacterium]
MPLDDAALRELYVRFGFAVHRRCRRLLGSDAEADDALQEVFVRARRYGDGYRGDAPLAWLYRIADRHCLTKLGERRRRAGDEETARALERLAEAPADRDAERTWLVGEVLTRVKPRVREVAVLYWVDEMTQDEVAEATGYSRKTVKEKLAEFLAAARALLDVEGSSRPERPRRDASEPRTTEERG